MTRERERAGGLAKIGALGLLLVLGGLAPGCKSTSPRVWSGAGYQEDEFDDFDEFEEEGEDEGARIDEAAFDPLSGYNRVMFKVNDKFYVWVWDPVARGYRWVLPEEVRVSIGRVFRNATTPVRFVNDVLQLEIDKAGVELGRLLVNTTLGLGGLFDPADSWFGWDAPASEDLGQTLGSYGVGEGFPLVLPFLGPSNLRDALALFPDGFLNPVYYIRSNGIRTGVTVERYLNYTSLHIGEYESIKEDALDPYTFMRDAYQANRQKAIDE